MSETVATHPSRKKLFKKQLRQTVYEKLALALADYKELESKKFKSNLKKASKLFAEDISKAAHKVKKVNGEKKINGEKKKKKETAVEDKA
jgi:hypothetical protein